MAMLCINGGICIGCMDCQIEEKAEQQLDPEPEDSITFIHFTAKKGEAQGGPKNTLEKVAQSKLFGGVRTPTW